MLGLDSESFHLFIRLSYGVGIHLHTLQCIRIMKQQFHKRTRQAEDQWYGLKKASEPTNKQVAMTLFIKTLRLIMGPTTPLIADVQ